MRSRRGRPPRRCLWARHSRVAGGTDSGTRTRCTRRCGGCAPRWRPHARWRRRRPQPRQTRCARSARRRRRRLTPRGRCRRCSCAPRHGAAAEPPPAHIFQHSGDLVPCVDALLAGTRNVGLVGMGGIGKTTIARAVFARAQRRFDDSVWLTVGSTATDMLPLLRSAFAQLFPGSAETFETAAEALSDLAQRLQAQRRSVLLVLDDVWPSRRHAVIAALNFATRARCRSDGSRLLVTTRQHSTLSYDPAHTVAPPMDELRVEEVLPLSTQHAQQLFHHHAFGACDAAPPKCVPRETCAQLIDECGGNPLALEVLGRALSDCGTPEQWEQRLADFRWQQRRCEDPASAVCAVSIAALPPSLREYFVDFAAFPEDERVAEADVVHLFATHAPLHTPHSVRAAQHKLNELVQRSLLSVAPAPGGRGTRTCHMHDILRALALRYAAVDASGRSFDADAAHDAARVRRFSAHKHGGSLANRLGRSDHLRACVLGATHADPPTDRRPQGFAAPRLRYLRTACAGGCELGDAMARGAGSMPVLSFLSVHECRGAAALLEHVLPAVHLAHIDLCGCAGLTLLPESLGRCTQLTHLALASCMHLSHLPESLAIYRSETAPHWSTSTSPDATA